MICVGCGYELKNPSFDQKSLFSRIPYYCPVCLGIKEQCASCGEPFYVKDFELYWWGTGYCRKCVDKERHG